MIFFLLILSISTSFIFKNNKQKTVVIYQDEKNIYTGNLAKNKIIKINDEIIIEILNEKVRMKKSNCSHQYCVQQGWTKSFPIICVPNKLMISIKNNDAEKILITR
ncbi:MAG: NusG domain II-containing protein [Candidatus Cloacimonetes bacterium]|nr:NusG domain II-containing protein [Candidatus Cloacimonadota bacterium]MBT6994016.1 NusG domain II-containing protein [Candidatus Cloacimonadota bacterium]MBT7469829.1 NusG domain II-containing protein [Candidatus Cloacimonadota bacterium]